MKTHVVLVAAIFLSACTPIEKTLLQQQPSDDILIHGNIVTPSETIRGGWIEIAGDEIVSVSANKPATAATRVLETNGYVYPGLIDLHNHPLYNAIPRWTPPKTFANRNEWRRDYPEYTNKIGAPESYLISTNYCEDDKYVELKGLIGGTTATIGTSPPRGKPMPDCIVGLARNLDWASGLYGNDVGHERISFGIDIPDTDAAAAKLAAKLANGELDLYAIHIAEGKRDDLTVEPELRALDAKQLLTSRTAVIHGSALNESDFALMRMRGASLIWSPRSNIELYGETTDIASAQRHGIPIALAPDWSPTGDTNLLAAISYAKTYSDTKMGGTVSAKQLFEMATSVPADIAKIGDKLGRLQPGQMADLFVLESSNSDPYAALAEAKPGDIELTMVGGNALFGSSASLTALGAQDQEPLDVCGQQRAINSQAFGAQSLADVTSLLSAKLADKSVTLAPLAECQ